jgi:hypothetical protein
MMGELMRDRSSRAASRPTRGPRDSRLLGGPAASSAYGNFGAGRSIDRHVIAGFRPVVRLVVPARGPPIAVAVGPSPGC